MATDAEISAFRALMDERDRRYEVRFAAIEEASQTTIAALDRLTTARFDAGREALAKAEASHTKYEGITNDLRRTFLPKAEAESRFVAIEEKLSALVISRRGQSNVHTGWVIGIVVAIVGWGLTLALSLLHRG